MNKGWIVAWAMGMTFAVPAGAQGDVSRSSVDKLNAAWDGAFNKSDAAALADLYDANAVVSPGNGKVLTGRDEIRKLFQSFFDAGVRNHRIQPVKTGGSGDTLHQVARWSAEGPEKDGKRPTLQGILSSAFTRGSDGQWRCVSHVWNAGE